MFFIRLGTRLDFFILLDTRLGCAGLVPGRRNWHTPSLPTVEEYMNCVVTAVRDTR